MSLLNDGLETQKSLWKQREDRDEEDLAKYGIMEMWISMNSRQSCVRRRKILNVVTKHDIFRLLSPCPPPSPPPPAALPFSLKWINKSLRK